MIYLRRLESRALIYEHEFKDESNDDFLDTKLIPNLLDTIIMPKITSSHRIERGRLPFTYLLVRCLEMIEENFKSQFLATCDIVLFFLQSQVSYKGVALGLN